MVNHPNRSKKRTALSNPQPEDIIKLRFKHDLTQPQAAELWMVDLSTVQKWEAPVGASNHRRIHPLMWWAIQKILKEKV